MGNDFEASAALQKAEKNKGKIEAQSDPKAARSAAKKARAALEEPDLAAEKAARKIARAEARAAQEEIESAAEAKAARKLARKAARESQSEEPSPSDPTANTMPEKRKASSDDIRSTADAKQRKVEDGKAVATKELGAAAFRQLHEIVVAETCPAPFETFDAARSSFGEKLIKALDAQGYTAPTPIQAQAWPIALTGQDMVSVAKTGSGKTCGFLLPALARIAERGPAPEPKKLSWSCSEPATPSVLVVAPTRELALQIAGEAEKFAHVVGAKVVTLYGGTPKGPQIGACRKGVDILIGTPGRLNDLLEGNAARGLSAPVSLEKVTYLVLDEADQMLDMGFEPDIRKLVARCPGTGAPEDAGGASGANTKRQTLFFTATWPWKVQAAAASLTSNAAVQVRIAQNGGKLSLNKSVTHEVVMCEWKDKMYKLKAYLKDNLGPNDSAIVFSATKGGCDFLETTIQEDGTGIWCRAIHGDKEQWQRERMLGEFRAKVAEGKQAVLVATDVAARGLDIPGIAVVVVYDFSAPKQPAGIAVESFVHRIGRTGRAGKTGRALTLWTSEDKGATALVKLLEEAGQEVPQGLKDAAAWERPERGSKPKGKGKGKGKGKSYGSRW